MKKIFFKFCLLYFCRKIGVFPEKYIFIYFNPFSFYFWFIFPSSNIFILKVLIELPKHYYELKGHPAFQVWDCVRNKGGEIDNFIQKN